MGNRAKIASIYSIVEPIGALSGVARIAVRFGGRLPAYYASQSERESTPRQVAVEEAAAAVQNCVMPGMPLRLTLTGGEPLFYADWITRLIKRVPKADVLLRTEGTQVKALAQVLPLVSLVSLHWELEALERLVAAHQDISRSLQLINLRCGEVVLHISSTMFTGERECLSSKLETVASLLAEADCNSLPICMAIPHKVLKDTGEKAISLAVPLLAAFPNGKVFFYN